MDLKKAAIAVLVVYGLLALASGDIPVFDQYIIPVRNFWHGFLYKAPAVAVLLFIAAVVILIMKPGGGGAHK